MSEAEKYWNEYYTGNQFKNGKEVSPFIVEMKHRLQKGKVLDIGMGEGNNAVFLAKEGYAVKGFDISPKALETAAAFATEMGVAVEGKKADLDLFLMGLLEYDTVIMFNFKPSLTRYYTEIVRALKQGGTLLVESFTTEEMTELITPEEAYKNFYFASNELLHHLRGLRILFYHEGIIRGRHRVQCLAQKPLEKDAAKYGLFDMQSKQKDAGPSAQMKLAEALFKKKD